MNIYHYNRLLWSLLLLAILAGGIYLWQLASTQQTAADISPLAIPKMVVSEPRPGPTALVTERNIFSRDGTPWARLVETPEPRIETGKVTKDPRVDGILGLILLPGYNALLTEQGVVLPGDVYQGGMVDRIGQGQVRFKLAGEAHREIPLFPGRQQREKALKRLGFPVFESQ